MKYDVVVIGAGPAGISSAIYTARAKLKTVVIGKVLESKLTMSHMIHNYFGFRDGIEGHILLKNGTEQAKKFGAQIIEGEVIDIKRTKQGFEIKDSKNKKYQTSTVIIATGSKIESTGIRNEKELTSRGVFYCAACDGPLFRNKNIAVVGNGDHAAEEAIELRAQSKNVSIISHKNSFKISKELMKEIKKKKIEMIEGEILEFYGKKMLEKIIMKTREIKCDAAFIATGTTSSSSIARKLGLQMLNNAIIINNKGETDIKGIYAAGEAAGMSKQVGICVGEGVNAALSAIKYLRKKDIYVDYA
jgi:thioredoxin reductase (NADPH)